MKYFKLGTTLFAIFALTSGLALLITGWIIAGSSNTKNAEMKYHALVYEQALVSADAEYKSGEAEANGVYDAWYNGWLAEHPKPSSSYQSDLIQWNSDFAAANAQPEADKNAAVSAAAKNRDDEKAAAIAAYDRALLNIKRNFKGTDNGQTFTGTYRAANTLTTVKTTVTEKSGGDDLSSVTYETVLSPAGALLVAGMILFLVGGATGTCMAFTYLGVWEKIIDKSKQPKQPRAPKDKTPREPKEVKEDKQEKQSVAIKDVTPPAEEEFAAETPAPVERPASAEQPMPPLPPAQPSIYGQQWQS